MLSFTGLMLHKCYGHSLLAYMHAHTHAHTTPPKTAHPNIAYCHSVDSALPNE